MAAVDWSQFKPLAPGNIAPSVAASTPVPAIDWSQFTPVHTPVKPNALTAPFQFAGSALSGTAGQILGGLAGLGDIPLHALGITDTSPADVVGNVENALTYRPQNPDAQKIASVVGYPFRKLAQGSDYLGGRLSDSVGGVPGALLGTAVSTGLQALPMLIPGTRLAGSAVRGAADASRVLADAPATAEEAAINAGFKIPPSAASGFHPILRTAEGLSNSSRLRTGLNTQNQGVVDSLVKGDLGIPETVRATPDVLEALKPQYNSVYDEVSKVGNVPTDETYAADLGALNRTPGLSFNGPSNPDIVDLQNRLNVPQFDAADAIHEIRDLRANAKSNFKAVRASTQKNSASLGDLATAQQRAADMLENQIERHLTPAETASIENGGVSQAPVTAPTLMDRFRNARVQLAKINSAQRAAVGNSGHFSAPALVQMADRGVPLSGGMKVVASVGKDFPGVMRKVESLRNAQPMGRLGGTFSAYGLGDMLTGNPLRGGMIFGSQLFPLPVRGLLGSGIVQKTLAKGAAKGAAANALRTIRSQNFSPAALGLLGTNAAAAATSLGQMNLQ